MFTNFSKSASRDKSVSSYNDANEDDVRQEINEDEFESEDNEDYLGISSSDEE